MGNLNPMVKNSGCLLNKFVIIVALVLLGWGGVEGARKAKPLELKATSVCLDGGEPLVVKCKLSSEKINIKSVAYAHTPDCHNPAKDNKCTQVSKDLSRKAQKKCNGKNQCTLEVLSITDYRATVQNPDSGEFIQFELNNCGVDKKFLTVAKMNILRVQYECKVVSSASIFDLYVDPVKNSVHRVERSMYGRGRGEGESRGEGEGEIKPKEYAFCNAISDEVIDVTIATKGFPAKVVTNPTCGCTFESEDPEAYILSGYTQCNGTVVFVVEETSAKDDVTTLEYLCDNQIGRDFIVIGNKKSWRLKVDVDKEKSSEESSYQIKWFNVKPQTSVRKKDGLVKVDCKKGRIYLPYTVRLILYITLPVGTFLIIAAIVVYCIFKKRRRQQQEWRARHVRLAKPAFRPQEDDMLDESPLTPVFRSPNSSISSFPHQKDERVDPEGNVDDIGEYAAELKKKNEERRRKELERRQGYQYPSRVPPSPLQHTLPHHLTPTPPTHTPPPTRSTMPSRRSQSIGNLRPSERRHAYADNMDTPADNKPLAYSKSASQSRASLRSQKRRAPPAPGGQPVPAPVPVHNTRTTQMYASSSFTSTPSINSRLRSRQGSTPVLPSSNPPTSLHYGRPRHPGEDNPYTAPYSTRPPLARSPSSVSSPSMNDIDPAGRSDDEEEMSILRPGKPAVAPKPTRQKYNSPGQRYPPSKPGRSLTPGDMQDLQRELDSDSDSDYVQTGRRGVGRRH